MYVCSEFPKCDFTLVREDWLTAMSLGESVEWSHSTVVLTSNAQ